jgi:hypothetical protein
MNSLLKKEKDCLKKGSLEGPMITGLNACIVIQAVRINILLSLNSTFGADFLPFD